MSRRRPPRRQLALCSIIPLAFLAACGGDDDGEAEPATEGEVRVVDNAFEPADVEVAVGDTVTWVWEGAVEHNVKGEGFESELREDGTFEHEFTEPGTYEYLCTVHAGMKGEVVVS